MNPEERCSNCGALLSAEAQWCGQCLAPVVSQDEADPARTEPAAAAPDPAGDAEPATGGATGNQRLTGGDASAAYWACPVCGEENPLDATLCSVCGTPFGRLFDDLSAGPKVSPAAASRAGLVPGLGHIRAGKTGEGLVRMVAFAMSLAFLLMFLSAGTGGWALVVTTLYIVFCFSLVAESYLDAGRAAAGERELISGRNLLWAVVALLGVSVGLVVLLSVGVQPGAQ